jgi:hypothetical protein
VVVVCKSDRYCPTAIGNSECGRTTHCRHSSPSRFNGRNLSGGVARRGHSRTATRPLPTLGVGVLRVGCASHCRHSIMCRRKAVADESERLLPKTAITVSDPLLWFATGGSRVFQLTTFCKMGETFFVLPTRLNVECPTARWHIEGANPCCFFHRSRIMFNHRLTTAQRKN